MVVTKYINSSSIKCLYELFLALVCFYILKLYLQQTLLFLLTMLNIYPVAIYSIAKNGMLVKSDSFLTNTNS